MKNYGISPLAEEAFSYPCLLEADLRPTAGFTCLSRSLPNIMGNAIIPLSLSSPRELCIAVAPQCVWLGVLFRKHFLAHLPLATLSPRPARGGLATRSLADGPRHSTKQEQLSGHTVNPRLGRRGFREIPASPGGLSKAWHPWPCVAQRD